MAQNKEKLTKRQKELLNIIYNYILDTGYPPTFEEMKESLGVASNQSVIDLLDKLKSKKFIKKEEGTARGITILPAGYEILKKPVIAPVLGTVVAGNPTEAIRVEGDFKMISKDLAKLNSNVFILKISGDSMINAGINEGDLILVKEEKEFYSGDIVLAENCGEETVKKFISDDKPPFVYLKPENPKYSIIPFTEETRLRGKVISIFKNGQWDSIKK